MDAPGKFGEHVAPIAHFVRARHAEGLARADDEVDGGSEAGLPLRRNASFHFGVDRPRSRDKPTGIYYCTEDSFPTRGSLAGENDGANAIVREHPSSFGECSTKLPFIVCDIVCRVAQLMWAIHDYFLVLWHEFKPSYLWVCAR